MSELRSKALSRYRTIKRRCSTKKAYIDCYMCDEWANDKELFIKWFETNFVEGFEIDKDIIKKGNREYSPSYCRFVPRPINEVIRADKVKPNGIPQGVHFDNERRKYRAGVSVFGKVKKLGRFDDLKSAMNAYKIAKERYIKTLANKYRDVLGNDVYSSLMRWEVEIIV